MGICLSYVYSFMEMIGKRPVLREYNGTYHWRELQSDMLPTFECRPDDVWVCSFPRSGTTITQQIVYLVMTGNFEASRTVQLDIRFPFADLYQPLIGMRGLDYITKLPRDNPRMIKSHLHYFLLPEQLKQGYGKIIYVVRNPKSSAPSLFKLEKYYYKQPITESLEEYLEQFLANKTLCTPWGLHVNQYWEQSKKSKNILIIQFDDLVKNRKSVIRDIGEFLEKDLSEEQVTAIFNETSLESMKYNQAVNLSHMEWVVGKSKTRFINDGLTDGWKETMSPDMINRMDDMIQRTVGHTDLKFS